jgi:hypothetical protein
MLRNWYNTCLYSPDDEIALAGAEDMNSPTSMRMRLPLWLGLEQHQTRVIDRVMAALR